MRRYNFFETYNPFVDFIISFDEFTISVFNSYGLLGVSFVAIQALEKRSNAYHTEIELLKHQLEALKASNELLIKKLDAFKATK